MEYKQRVLSSREQNNVVENMLAEGSQEVNLLHTTDGLWNY